MYHETIDGDDAFAEGCKAVGEGNVIAGACVFDVGHKLLVGTSSLWASC